MSQLVNEFEYTLLKPITIHKDGGMAESTKLLLKAPSNKHRYNLIKLKQGFMRAIMSMQNTRKVSDKKDNAEEAKFDAKIIIMLLLGSDIDFSEYLNSFKDLICSELCLVDGVVQLNQMLFDQLSDNDCELLMGRYIETFLLSSWMSLLQAA